MEGILQCKMCCLEFNNICVIPTMLHCGHSVCKPCILKSTEGSLCPNCKEEINISEDSLKTNYSMLEMVEEFKKIRNAESLSLQSSEIVRKKCLQKEEILLKEKSEVESYLEVIDRGLSKLRKVTNSEDKEINAQETEEILSNLDMDFKKYGKFACFSMCGLNVSESISLSSFDDYEKYLCERVNGSAGANSNFNNSFSQATTQPFQGNVGNMAADNSHGLVGNQKLIYQIIKLNPDASGIHKRSIYDSTNGKINKQTVDQILNELTGEGLVFTSIDDFHFKTADTF